MAAVWPPNAAAGPAVTIVLTPERTKRIKRRYVRRTVRALRKTAKRVRRVAFSKRSCPLDTSCIANAGAGEHADRAVGVDLVGRGNHFKLTFLIVDVASGAELLRKSYNVKHSKLRRAPGTLLRKFLAQAKRVKAAPRTEPLAPVESQPAKPQPIAPTTVGDDGTGLTATAASGVAADGRSVVLFDVSDAPRKRTGELERQREVPAATCEGAAPLSPVRGRAAVLAPASARGVTLRCTVSFRGAHATARVKLSPPGPGLYAAADPAWVTAGSGNTRLTAFRVGSGGAATPEHLRAAVSSGDVTVAGRGQLAIALPVDRKPRMITVALADDSGPGAAFLPVWGETDLEVRADSRSSVQVRIGGRWFGPVVAKRRKAVVPIVVPPGIRRAVVRASDRKGYALESRANLKTPNLPRIAAVTPSVEIAAGAESFVAVALAGRDGRPAAANARVVARAQRGSLGDVEFVSDGLWRISYKAPGESGQERITVRVAGDKKAGTANIALNIGAGRPTSITLEVPEGPFRPGDRIEATAVVLDALGNRLVRPNATASLGGAPANVSATGDALGVSAAVPNRFSTPLRLVVSVGGLRAEKIVNARAAAPVSARVHSAPDGRAARVRVEVLDEFGNLVDRDVFAVAIKGARAGSFERVGDRYEAAVAAHGAARTAVVTVTVAGRELARGQIEFEPPPGTLLLGAYAAGGWFSNGGAVQTARVGGGVGLRRVGHRFELSLLLGAHGFMVDDRANVELAGMSRDVRRSIAAIEVPVVLRGRLRITRMFGVSVGVGVVPTRASVRVTPDFQRENRYTELVVGARSQLAFDARLGPGRVSLGAGYGTAQLSDGLVVGRVDGLSAFAGYEWWFADLGP